MQDTIYDSTPLFRSPGLDAELGCEVYFKMDCHQPTRSFKLRGMSRLVEHHVAAGRRRFVASSGGNAGYSLAYAAKRRGASVHVVVPMTTAPRLRALIAGEGATVQVHGESWIEAHTLALEIAAQEGAVYVSPFDDALLWDGHATMIDECAPLMPEPDYVVAAVGGGGLLCGIMEGMERNGWKRTRFLSAETEGAASMARALEAGEVVSLDAIDSIATSLGAKRVAEEAMAWARRRPIVSHLCTDAQAMSAVRRMLDMFQVLVEPACGATLTAVFGDHLPMQDAQRILVIVCGGVGLDSEGYWNYLRKFGLLES